MSDAQWSLIEPILLAEIPRAEVRTKAGRAEDPSLAAMDSQSNHAAVNVPAATTGKDHRDFRPLRSPPRHGHD